MKRPVGQNRRFQAQIQIFHFIIFLKKQIYIRNDKYKKVNPEQKQKFLQCYKQLLTAEKS